MNNLMSNEVQLFNENAQISRGLQISQITDLQTIIDESNSTKFDTSVKMSKLVLKSFKYFKSDRCKEVFEEEGISWSVEDFSQKIFGWNKSFFYKMVKIGNTPTTTINKFNREVNRLKEEGTPIVRSVENCLKFVKELNTEGNGEETPMTPRTETTLSVKMKFDISSKSFKIVNGEFKTDMTNDEVQKVMEKFAEYLSNNEYPPISNNQ
ncbi:MAG: hypothetical protein Unbinned1524contig1000_8 [Prokaryotic dsDNA virus sp.]|nr:MAG: hypothetical protein Unbinned1524contig1000_8 [Prokaryotic dsDNA virus sp.]